MNKIVAKILYKGKILGFVSEDNNYHNGPRYSWESENFFENKGKEIPNDIKTIEVFDGYEIETKTALAKTLDTMPVGTPLKIKGCVEGMEGQQLIYCGFSYDHDITWLKTYWFYDGKAATGDMAERFGYFEKQMFYDDTKVIFNKNNKKVVDELRDSFAFSCAVAESFG